MKITIELEDVTGNLYLQHHLFNGHLDEDIPVDVGNSGTAVIIKVGDKQYSLDLLYIISEINRRQDE